MVKFSLFRFFGKDEGIYLEDYHELLNITKGEKGRKDVKHNGIYDIINESLYAIYSREKKNYLFVKDKEIPITSNISIKCKPNWSLNELSYFEIYDDKKSIAKVEYKSSNKPIITPFDFFEDWEEVNFGCELKSLIEKENENPDVILFPKK